MDFGLFWSCGGERVREVDESLEDFGRVKGRIGHRHGTVILGDLRTSKRSLERASCVTSVIIPDYCSYNILDTSGKEIFPGKGSILNQDLRPLVAHISMDNVHLGTLE